MITTDTKNYFQYEMIGEFRSHEEWIHSERTINSHELIFVIEGCVHLYEESTFYTISPGEFIILEPGKKHGGWQTSEGTTSFFWFHFHTDMHLPLKYYNGAETYDVRYLLKKLLHMTNTPTYSKSHADAVGLLIFYELMHIAADSEIHNSTTGKVSEYIRINIDKELTVSSIASVFRYSPDYLSKLFRQNYGTSLKEYISLKKMQTSKQLLLSTDLSVKEIAPKLGFKTENLFIKFFIYHEKISPTKFRNKFFNTHMNKK